MAVESQLLKRVISTATSALVMMGMNQWLLE